MAPISTERLELRPLGPEAAAALPSDRDAASRALGAALHHEWPSPDLLGILGLDRGGEVSERGFGVWVIVERATGTVVGDAGFHGPPDAGVVEIGYSVVPDRRRRGYASEAATALSRWALRRPEVRAVVASCAATNVGSIRTLERSGFTRVGADGDLLRWRNEGAAGGAA